jgi:integrase
MFRIPADREKGNKDRLLPMAPEFAELLEQVPLRQRTGFVFNPRPRRRIQVDRLKKEFVGKRIREIARKANVVTRQLENGQVHYCSAHDLRRSFGERWSYRVVPRVLKELMRHENITTTEKFYLGQNAQKTAAVLWDLHRGGSSSPEVVSATLGDTSVTNP